MMDEFDRYEGFESDRGSSSLDDIRDELGDQLMAATATESRLRRRRWLRQLGTVLVGALILVPGALALESGIRGEDPQPAAPALLAPTNECPEVAEEFLRELPGDPSRLPNYVELPGYPFPGCPTLEDLQENEELQALLDRVSSERNGP